MDLEKKSFTNDRLTLSISGLTNQLVYALVVRADGGTNLLLPFKPPLDRFSDLLDHKDKNGERYEEEPVLQLQGSGTEESLEEEEIRKPEYEQQFCGNPQENILVREKTDLEDRIPHTPALEPVGYLADNNSSKAHGGCLYIKRI